MSDQIVLKGVSARGFHGVLEAEKRDGQPFVIDVHLTLDLSRAGRTDDLAATVNYADVASAVVARIAGPSFDLIERLAEVIADDVLGYPLVDAVEVVVHKPEAPVGHPFTDVEVRIRRSNGPRAVIALGSNLGDRGRTLSPRRRCPPRPARLHPSPRCRPSSRPTRWVVRSSRPTSTPSSWAARPSIRRSCSGAAPHRGHARPDPRGPVGRPDARPRPRPIRHARLGSGGRQRRRETDAAASPRRRARVRAAALGPGRAGGARQGGAGRERHPTDC